MRFSGGIIIGFILLAMLVIAPVMAAGTVTKTTTAPISEVKDIVENITVVKTGSTAISDSLATKGSVTEKATLLSSVTKTTLAFTKYPYIVGNSDNSGTIEITKYRCTSEMCGYWITATRGGKEVATNSPIWIYPPPYQVVVSEVETSSTITDSVKTVEKTITIVEDPKAAAESVLLRHVNSCPLGSAVVGTKE